MSKLSVHYFVCMVQRTGSNMLCEALSHTGLAGKPGEYFVPAFESAVVHGHAGFEDSSWAREHGITAFPQFVEAVLLEGRTANGVFGAKLPWNALASFHAKLRELPGNRNLRETELLPLAFAEPRFIHLQRRDRVRQAVSWALAAQTGHFASHQAIEAPAMEPRFDLDLLDGLYRLISEGCQGWARFFDDADTEPLQLWYEDIATDLEGAVYRILEWLRIDHPEKIALPLLAHQPQTSPLNAEWAARYREERGLEPQAPAVQHAVADGPSTARFN